MLACVFPGQGSQHVGMGLSFYQNFSAARQRLEWASDQLSLPLNRWFAESTEAELQDTERTQLMLFLTSYMIVGVVEEELKKSLPCQHVSGHSLGEYTALCVAGVWSPEDVLGLVRKRGLFMKKAASQAQNNGMMAVLGLDAEVINPLLGGTSCVVANDNCPGQVVLSGDTAELDQLQAPLKEAGAKRCVVLPVSGAFHSSFMSSAAQEMEPFLLAAQANEPCCKVWMNITAQPLNNEPVGRMMVDQITSGVRWRETVMNIAQNGVNVFVEMGAGSVLTQLNRRNAPDARHVLLNDSGQLDDVLSVLGQFV